MRNFSAKRNNRSILISSLGPAYLIAILAIIYFLSFTTLSVVQHHGLRTQMNDLGNVDQALWNAANGDLLMTQSNELDGKMRSRIGVHANFIFWPLSLFYKFWPYPELLLILTSLACAMAGIGLYLIARYRMGDTWLAVIPAGAFFLSPLVHDANLYDFHVITVYTTLIVWTFWTFDTGRKKTAWVLLVLALLCNEDVALITFMLGIYLMLSKSNRTGVPVAAISLFYFIVLLSTIVPYFNEGHGLSKLEGPGNRYAWLGNGFSDIIFSVISHPLLVLKTITRPDHLRIIAYLLLCGGLAGIKGWKVLLMALPQVALALLSSGAWMTRITGTYYWITCEAIIIIACTLSAAKYIESHPRKFPWHLAYLGCATVLLSVLLSPLPYSISSSWKNYSLPSERHILQEIKQIIPADTSLCVQNNLGSHLSQRHDTSSFPWRCDKADYALFHLRYIGGPDSGLFVRSSPLLFGASPQVLCFGVKKMVLSGDWNIIFQEDGFYLFQRRPSENMNLEELLRQLEIDYQTLENSYREASEHRMKWSRYFTGNFSWEHFF